jgi:hypothetical protein
MENNPVPSGGSFPGLEGLSALLNGAGGLAALETAVDQALPPDPDAALLVSAGHGRATLTHARGPRAGHADARGPR